MKFFQLTKDVLINLDHVVMVTKSENTLRGGTERFHRASFSETNSINIVFSRPQDGEPQPRSSDWKWPSKEERDKTFDRLREAMGIGAFPSPT